VHPIDYADDTYLIGLGPAITAAFPSRVQHGPAIRLTPSLHKCAVYSTPSAPTYAAAEQTTHILIIQHTTDGFVAAGTHVGTKNYILAYTELRADQAIALINKPQDLPQPLNAEAKFLILSRSLRRRLTHCSRYRVVRPPLALGHLATLQAAVENTA
jgi:hypothetical protein